MSQLNEWTEEYIVHPLSQAFEEYSADADRGLTQDEAAVKVNEVVEVVQKAIREKMLESYRNGQAAGPRRERRQYASRK